ncbi:hypothetical protein D3C78_1032480 [compost metagenome]
MHSHKVGLTHDFINAGQLNSDFLRSLFRHERIVTHNFHTERFGAFGHLASDTSHAKHAQGFVAKLNAKEGFTIPYAVYGFCIGLRNMTRKSHHHCKGVFTSRNGIAVRRINYDNTALSSCIQINVVYANSCATNHLKLFAGFHNFCGYSCLAADEKCIVFADNGYELILA